MVLVRRRRREMSKLFRILMVSLALVGLAAAAACGGGGSDAGADVVTD